MSRSSLFARCCRVVLAASSILAPAGFAAASSLDDSPGEAWVVDWGEGYVYAFGSGGSPPETVRTAARLLAAREAAWLEARGVLEQAVARLPFDGQATLRDALQQGARRAQRNLRQLLDEAEPVRLFQRADGSAGIWVRLPLYGRGGLGNPFGRDGGEDRSHLPLLLMEVSPEGVVPSPVIWPAVRLEGGRPWVDLPSLVREGRVPAAFSLARGTREELRGTVGGGTTVRVRRDENGADFVLESTSFPFDPADWRGIVIVEPAVLQSLP